jgi:hypothetical protein
MRSLETTGGVSWFGERADRDGHGYSGGVIATPHRAGIVRWRHAGCAAGQGRAVLVTVAAATKVMVDPMTVSASETSQSDEFRKIFGCSGL